MDVFLISIRGSGLLFQHFERRLDRLAGCVSRDNFSDCLIGLEKESLRVAPGGSIAQTPHPLSLGSALTHPYITTDYSEALLEFVTPPSSDRSGLLQFLQNIQTYVYSKLENEFLWTSSMPCVLAGEASIPIAEYGSSNIGKMKTVYRRGLGHRYSRVMQAIAGIHFNYSFSQALWTNLKEIEGNSDSLQAFTAQQYFNLIRNAQRFGWLIPYLFGSSPTVCKSFVSGMKTDMQEFDETTYYYPYATSLRMGDIGYQNRKEGASGIKVLYDNLESYISSLRYAITTPYPPYQTIGVKLNGEYEQLNANLLQIENEYYSSIRPKQIAELYEMPITALTRRGVAYVELRTLDINVFDHNGISEETLYFLEAFLLFCLICDSPFISSEEHLKISSNFLDVAHNGREPGLRLKQRTQEIELKQWAQEIFSKLEGVCELLDGTRDNKPYTGALLALKSRVENADETPSARILNEMRENKEGFFDFHLRKSMEHREYFQKQKLSNALQQEFEELSHSSITRQKNIEQSDKLNFDEFLAQYFSQTLEAFYKNAV